jgi:hypothetical protein
MQALFGKSGQHVSQVFGRTLKPANLLKTAAGGIVLKFPGFRVLLNESE